MIAAKNLKLAAAKPGLLPSAVSIRSRHDCKPSVRPKRDQNTAKNRYAINSKVT
jgi:hypothetical protein